MEYPITNDQLPMSKCEKPMSRVYLEIGNLELDIGNSLWVRGGGIFCEFCAFLRLKKGGEGGELLQLQHIFAAKHRTGERSLPG